MILKKPHIPSFDRFRTTFAKSADQHGLTEVKKFAGDELLRLKHRIENQDFTSFDEKPLSEKWLAYKMYHHLDLRTMIATGHYIESIKVFTRDNPDGSTTVYVGFDKNELSVDKDGNKGIPLYILAAVHENGSQAAHIPSRPHWGPQLATQPPRAVAVRAKIKKKVIHDMRKAGY